MHGSTVKLRYDGRWNDLPGKPRQWTIINHWIDADGADRFKGSFGYMGLVELGIVAPYAVRGAQNVA